MIIRAFFFALIWISCSSLFAERLPKWEVGLGGGALTIPDYRGSDESNVYPYPFIYPIYRGELLQADEEGIKGVLFESNRVRFDISYDGNVPVNQDNEARQDMAELEPTLQIGPAIRFKLWQSKRHRQSLILDLPVRAAFAVGSGIDQVGYTAYPKVAYRREIRLFDRDWRWNLSGGALFGNEDYHDYYYQVEANDATPNRPQYDADTGYAGTRFITSLVHRTPDYLFSLYGAYDNVDGATFESSPLVKQDSGLTVGFLLTWFVFQSGETVEVNQWEWHN